MSKGDEISTTLTIRIHFLFFYLTVPLAEKIPWNPMNRASIQTPGKKAKWNGNGACVPRCGMKALTCCYLACFFLQLRRLWALLPTPSPSPLASRSRLARETLVSSASIEFWSMTVDITALTQVRQLAQSAEKLLIGWQNKQPVSSKTLIGAYLWPLASCVHLFMSHCSCGRGLFYLRVWGFSCQTCHIYSLFICLLLLLLITSP